MHFAGHIFGMEGEGNTLDEASVYGLEKTILDKILAENIGYVYGALAAGSDIIIAEKALEANAEFHLVLPCPDELFISTSVAPFGDIGWRVFVPVRRQQKLCVICQVII